MICEALAAGYRAGVCVGEIEDARALAGPASRSPASGTTCGSTGFDFGNSPRELAGAAPIAETLVLTTTNGTRAARFARPGAARPCSSPRCSTSPRVVEAARGADDVAIFCAGVEGAFAIDDAYVAGRIAAALGGEPDDSAIAASAAGGRVRLRAEEGIGGGVSAANIRRVGLDEDIAWSARESVLEIVPKVVERRPGGVVEASTG